MERRMETSGLPFLARAEKGNKREKTRPQKRRSNWNFEETGIRDGRMKHISEVIDEIMEDEE